MGFPVITSLSCFALPSYQVNIKTLTFKSFESTGILKPFGLGQSCSHQDRLRLLQRGSKKFSSLPVRSVAVCRSELSHSEERSSPDEIAELLDCTSWTGAGPGLMDAATKGALQAGKPVGGFKIGKEAGQWTSTNIHPYLTPETYFTCRFFSARKHGLVDAVVRSNTSDRTAVVALPGGIGTLDEIFEILALIQLERIGSKLPVPFVLMNYDSFYSKLLNFLDVCEAWGTVNKGEVASLWKVCNNNEEALVYLEEFYNLTRRAKEGVVHGLGSAPSTSTS